MTSRNWGSLLVPALVVGALAAPATPATAAPAEARSGAGIRVAVKKDQVKLGKKVVVTGKVTGKRSGKITRVKLQQKRPGKRWKTQSVAKVNRKGRFKLKDQPTTATVRAYRVVSATGPKRTSAKLKVTVFEWRDLTRMTPRQRDAFDSVRQVGIDGVDYGRSFRGRTWSSRGMIDFNLARECTHLRARFGMGDDADADASVTIRVTADNTEIYARTFGLTGSERRTIRLEPAAFRLGLAYDTGISTDGSPDPTGAQAVVVEPEVRCSRR